MKLGKPKRYTFFLSNCNASDLLSSSSSSGKCNSSGSSPVVVTMANSNSSTQNQSLVTSMSSWLLVPRGRNFRHILATVLCVILVYHVTLLAIPAQNTIPSSSSSLNDLSDDEINSLPLASASGSADEISQPQPQEQPQIVMMGTSAKSGSQDNHVSQDDNFAPPPQNQNQADAITITSGNNNYNYYYTDEVGIGSSSGNRENESANESDNDNFNGNGKASSSPKSLIDKRASASGGKKFLYNLQYQKRRKLLDSIFFSVKSTKRFHQTRLGPVIKTWFNLAKDQTWIFTDDDDPELNAKTNGHVINTHCPSTHYRQALCCKMSAEFDTFIKSQKSWFCHFDDDNYVNVPALLDMLSKYDHKEDWYLGKPSLKIPIKIPHPDNKSEEISFWFATGGAGFCLSKALAKRMSPVASGGKFTKLCDSIQLPDDVTIGYIAGHLLGRNLTVIPQFHSHYETMRFLDMKNPYPEITFSYVRYWDNSLNTLEIDGFSEEEDPTRFMSLHCLLFPNFSFCPQKNNKK